MDIVCIVFQDQQTADTCLAKLNSLHDERFLDIDDACVAIRDEAGNVYLKQGRPRVGIGGAVGAFGGLAWGLLLAFLFNLNPSILGAAGTVIASSAGALIGKMSDFGIDDKFIQSIADELRPGTSAVFVLFGQVTSDKVLPHLRWFGGTLLTSTLPPEREARLRAALAPLIEQQKSDNPI